jgi:hypothetical protein
VARCAPKSHNGIADELVYRAAFLFDAGGDGRERCLLMNSANLDSGHSFACRCEADDIGEHNGEHTFFEPGADTALLNESHDQCARR